MGQAAVKDTAREIYQRKAEAATPKIIFTNNFSWALDRKVTAQPPIDILRPYDADEMELATCNPAVGNVKNNGPEMLVCPTSDEPLSLLNSA